MAPRGSRHSTGDFKVVQNDEPPPDAPRPGERWADFEFRVAIREYLPLLEAELDGLPAEKAAAWRRVMAGAPARSKGSVEYRFQNISHVLAGLGYPWVRGYPPASNTGHDLPPIVVDELARRPELEARLKAMKDDPTTGTTTGSPAEESSTSTAGTFSGGSAQAPAGVLPVNPYAAELLGWHAHAQGGVSVPFRRRGRPLGRTVETTLHANLKRAAETIKAAEPGPRWIFLVGGPGNGKSQMVEEFGRFLDDAAPGAGLADALEKAFAADPVPRRVDFPLPEPGEGEWVFRQLTVIQDASSSDRPDGNAAALLVDDLEGLLAGDRPAGHVFICSANRGLLARAVRTSGSASAARALLREVFRWTGLGEEALSDPMHKTWPLATDGLNPSLVAAWPLDAESLLAGETPGFAQLLQEATRQEHWEDGVCSTCPSRVLCPFLANAVSLRDPSVAGNLINVLRRAELASGQRINFRMSFSMVAELMVGDASDFDGAPDGTPCGWIHARVALASEDTKRGVAAVAELVAHESAFALVPLPTIDPRASFSEDATTAGAGTASDVFRGLEAAAATRESRAVTPVRELVRDTVASLIDPAAWSPTAHTDPLRVVEDVFAQGVSEGVAAWPAAALPTDLELRLIDHLRRAEEEAEERFAAVGRVAAQRVTAAARVAAATIAKRSIGVRLGITNQDDLLAAYGNAVRSAEQLLALRSILRDVIGSRRFVADALAGFGSVESSGSTALLRAAPMTIGPILPAPPMSADRAAHDLPVVLIELRPAPDARHRPMPLTFALFRALRLFEAGAANASLPASVRASLDALGQAYASRASRNTQALRNRDNDFAIMSVGGDEIIRLVLPADGGDLLVPEVS
jgi:hypothetical protein